MADPDEEFPVDLQAPPEDAVAADYGPPGLDLGTVQPDAPMRVKARFGKWVTAARIHPDQGSTVGAAANVVLPGQSATSAVGSRAPVQAAAVAGDAFAGARHNWIPTGPRNVGGRVRAIAIHPTDPLIMYAGPASGGIHKSVDGGETWFALWHDEPSLAIGAISICAANPHVVWVATGEVRTGGAEIILGDGVYRSTDDGANWSNLSVPHVPGPVPAAGAQDNRGFSFDAIAAHPDDDRTAWAVGPGGVFRTTNAGGAWTLFDPGVYYSDVVFSRTSTGAPILYLVQGAGTVIRLMNPNAADAAITPALALAANQSVIPPSTIAGLPAPLRGKLAICEGNRNVAYIRLASAQGADGRFRHLGVWRTRTARVADPGFTGIAWAQLADHPDWLPNPANPDAGEAQGNYNLSIAVNPRNSNHVATGMVELYLSRNANANVPANVVWLRAQAWDLYHLDRAHHADNHGAHFAPQPGAAAGTDPALWVNNDGGISRSTDWRTGAGYPSGSMTLPLPPGVITWRKRSHGISAAQMYDITQSPLVASMFGCGFQDNGVFITLGGLSWRLVLTADGGFVAFDPDDPYRLLATWQSGIGEVLFPGALEGRLPLPGDTIQQGLWPRELSQSFLVRDGAAFVADTAHHPTRTGHVLHTRKNRLYARRRASGERFSPEPVGRGLELLYDSGTLTSTLVVQPSPGAIRLGLAPQIDSVVVPAATPRVSLNAQAPAMARARSWLPGPYALQQDDELHVVVNGTPKVVKFRAGPAFASLGAATVAEVAAFIRAAVPELKPHACLWPRPLSVELTTTGVGAGARITLGGTALGRLGFVARAYDGDATRPASVSLIAINRRMPAVAGVPPRLTVQIGAGPVRNLDFTSPPFANLESLRDGELATALRTLLAGQPVTVTAVSPFKGVLLTVAAGPGLTLAGTALPALGHPGGPPPIGAAVALSPPGIFNSYDLTAGGPPALQLTLNDGVNPAATLTFTPPLNGVTDFRTMTAEELQRIVQAFATANGLAITAELTASYDDSQASEITHAPGAPDTVWVGGEDGALFRRAGEDRPWETFAVDALLAQDRRVEAIAIDPRDANRVYVGLEGVLNGAGDPGFLFRTVDGGAHWNEIGATVTNGVGERVGVYAIEVDPDAPDRVYVGTDAGVFRSIDGGDHWVAFNQNLPNAAVRDLAFSASTRTLRAGVWGRGTFERHVGERPPVDVRLYVRMSDLDQGLRPAPRGPAGFDTTPRAIARAESPDIKVARARPRGIGIDELVDGVEFDEDIRHEAPAPGPTQVFVQVHNGGAFPATGVRYLALWADAGNGPPALAADFWARFAAGPLAGAVGDWQVIGDDTINDAGARGRIVTGYPRVHTFGGFAWPADLDAHRRIGILLLVSSLEDPLVSIERDVATLIEATPKVAYRETATVRAADDRRFVLRATNGAQITVTAPPAGTAAALKFGGLPAGPAAEIRSGAEPFSLSAGAPQSLVFSVATQTITVTFNAGPGEIGTLAAATPLEVFNILGRELTRAGLPAVCEAFFSAGAGSPLFLRLRGLGRTQIQIVGGAAAATLGLPIGPPAAQVNTAPAPAALWNLTGAPAQTLTIAVTPSAQIQLPQGPDDLPSPLSATLAHNVRRVLNQRFNAAGLPIRAEVPRVDLWVRRTITDIDGAPVSPSARHLADLVAEPAAVAAGPGRTALFDLVRVHALDRLKTNAANSLYLRAANLGTVVQTAARHQLWRLDLSVSPITATLIAGPVNADVPAGGSGIVEFTWNPGALAVGTRVFVLAVCDHPTDRPLAVPATFASTDVIDTLCRDNPNAAYREFVVGP